MGGNPASARDTSAALANGDALKGLCLSDRLRVCASVNDCALAAENRIGRRSGHRSAGYAAGPADRDMLRGWVDRWRYVQRCPERCVANARIIAFAHCAHIPKAKICDGCDNAGCDPCAFCVDLLYADVDIDVPTNLRDLAIVNKHGRIGDRFTAITCCNSGICDGNMLSR